MRNRIHKFLVALVGYVCFGRASTAPLQFTRKIIPHRILSTVYQNKPILTL